MFGFDEDYCDAHCESCGAGYYFDVGFPRQTCAACGGELRKRQEIPPPENTEWDDVLLDERYLGFDDRKAFRILRELGRLDECQVSYDD